MMHLAFYCATHPKSPWLSRLTDWLSGGYGYSHVEMVFSDGMSFSSSAFDSVDLPDGRTLKNGVRIKQIDYAHHPDRWRLVPLPFVSPKDERAMREWAEKTWAEGHGYDFNGVSRFVLPWMREHPEKYFCSEVCATAMEHAGFRLFDAPPHKLAPYRMAMALI